MNKLFIHLGTPKTATTAIQYFLHNNNEQLLTLGYEFPDTQADFKDDKGFAQVNNVESAFANGNIIMDAQVLTAYKESQEAFEDILSYVFPDMAEYYRAVIADNKTDFDIFAGYLREKLEKHNVIISSENLWTFNYGFMERFAQEFGNRIEIIVYLRRQDSYVESMWNEVIKLGVVSDIIEDYLFFMLSEENDNHGLRYKRRLQRIAKIVGKENIHVRLFEDQTLKTSGGISFDFLRTIGIAPEKYEWTTPKIKVNERISGPAVNMKRIFNEYLQHKVGSKGDILDQIPNHVGRYNRIFSRLSTEYVKTLSGKDFYFSADYRMRMERLFLDDNTWIAQEFFGKLAKAYWQLDTLARKVHAGEFVKDTGDKNFAITVSPAGGLVETAERLLANFYAAMEDDFNTALAITHMFELAKEVDDYYGEFVKGEVLPVSIDGDIILRVQAIYLEMASIIGIFEQPVPVEAAEEEKSFNDDELVNALMQIILNLRQGARVTKNWVMADKIRHELKEAGIIVEDTPNGATWKRA